MKSINILCVCGFGIGSSLMLKMKVDEMLRDNGLDCETFTSDVTTAKSKKADVVFTSEEISSQLIGKLQCPLIIIKNFVDKKEIKEKGLDVVKKLMEE